MKKFFAVSIFLVLSLTLVTLSVKGKLSGTYYDDHFDTSMGGPFEATNSTSRFALIQSIVENGTFFFNEAQAKFSAPDIVYYQGKYFSIFTPGVSWYGIPFYLLGKAIGYAQLAVFSSTILIALLNMLLIIILARRFGAGMYASLLSSFVFLFSTNALAYALTFTQHHASTLLILLSLVLVTGKPSKLTVIWLGALFGVGALIDIPNLFLLLPFLIYEVFREFHWSKIGIRSALTKSLLVLVGLLPFLVLFGWYNTQLAGSPLRLGQMLGRSDYPHVEEISEETTPTSEPRKLPFNTRSQLNGFYTLLVSDERSIFYYSPVIVLGILGLIVLYRKGKHVVGVVFIAAIVLVTLVIYTLHGDPWGGWAFGSRYMIPPSAVLAIGLAVALTHLKTKPWFACLFVTTVIYSTYVSLAGALTTTLIPPKVEAINLDVPIPHTYKHNLNLIDTNFSSSLIYNLYFARHFTVKEYMYGYLVLLGGVVFVLYGFTIREEKK